MSNTKNKGLEKSPFDEFINSLKGKVVKINRGGPESKQGILLDYQDDYIALLPQDNDDNEDAKNEDQSQNEQEENNEEDKQDPVIYYQIKHIKSIIEDSKTNSTQTLDKEDLEVDFVQASNLKGIVTEYKDKYIQINQGGPESKEGLVLEVSDDYIVLFTDDDGVVYYNIQHVKSICESQQDENEDDNNENESEVEKEEKKPIEFLKGDNFHKLFSDLQHKWVSINRGGPEAVEGVLVEVTNGHFTLVSNEEVLRIHPYHIKSLSSGPKGSLKKNNSNDNDEVEAKQEKNEQKEENENQDMYLEKDDKKDKYLDIDKDDKHHEKDLIYRNNDEINDYKLDKSYRLRITSGDRLAKSEQYTGKITREDVVKTIDYKWSPKKRRN